MMKTVRQDIKKFLSHEAEILLESRVVELQVITRKGKVEVHMH